MAADLYRLVDAKQIQELVPHSDKMCLLERVLDWNDQSIRCETSSHLKKDNPLRRQGQLSSVCGIEYAAQAMALHAALCAHTGSRGRHGYLASVRDTRCSTPILDENDFPLLVCAEQDYADGSSVIYSFSIECDGSTLVSGRAAVVLSQH